MNSIDTFLTSGRGFIESELIEWDGIDDAGPFFLQNVRRGVSGTVAASHTATDTVYNSWLHERIETMTSFVDDGLTSYDPFGDVRSPSDPTPKTIELVTRKFTLAEAFQKLGVQRADRAIQKTFQTDAEKIIAALEMPEGSKGAMSLEPQWFVDTLVFASQDILDSEEALLLKPGLDPYTASIGNVGIKVFGSNYNERSGRAQDFASDVEAIVYWSEIHQGWIFKTFVTIAANTNIHYKFSNHRQNNFRARRAMSTGTVKIRRG